MVTKHRDLDIQPEQRFRFASLMSLAADDAGLPADPEFRAAFVGYLEWGTRLAMSNSGPGRTSSSRLRSPVGLGRRPALHPVLSSAPHPTAACPPAPACAVPPAATYRRTVSGPDLGRPESSESCSFRSNSATRNWPSQLPDTVGALRASGHVQRSVKAEIRANLLELMRAGKPPVPWHRRLRRLRPCRSRACPAGRPRPGDARRAAARARPG
jgi:hypothetical protein